MQDGVMVPDPQHVLPAGQFTPALPPAPGQLLGATVVGAAVVAAAVGAMHPPFAPHVFPEGQQIPVPMLVQQTSSAVQNALKLKPASQKVVPAAPQSAVEDAPGPSSPPQTEPAGH